MIIQRNNNKIAAKMPAYVSGTKRTPK